MRNFLSGLSTALLLALPLAALAQGVGIGTVAPDASAALDITATAKGVLVPRLSQAQRTGIASPATGLLVFQTDAPAGFYYNAGTSAAPAWTRLATGTGTGWSLSGNAGTDSTTNYLGTTDAKPLRLGTGGTEQARLSINGALWLGGRPAGGTAGFPANNLLLGYQAGKKLASTAFNNHFVGYQAGLNTTTGSENYFSGYRSGYVNTTGSQNQFIGLGSGSANTTGGTNQFSGYGSGTHNTMGSQNQFSGYFSGYANITGSANQFEGYFSGCFNTGGSSNCFIGYYSGYSNSTGSNNQFVGYQSGYYNTTGYANHFNGYQSGYNNITGSNNQFSGSQSGFKNTTGSYNQFSGEGSGYSNTTGVNNQFEGNSSGYFNTMGRYNHFTGYYGGYHNTAGNNNYFSGFQSGFSNTTGSNNQFIGFNSGYFNTTGASNYFGGYGSGSGNTTGSYNSLLGYNADVSTGVLTNATALGANAVVSASNTIQLGNSSIVSLRCQVALTVSSDARFKYNVRPNVPGLAFITKLRPVTYRFDAAQLETFTRTGTLGPGRADKSAAVQSGFLAQEVETAARSLGYAFDGLRVPASAREHYGLAYSQFVVPLVRAVQEQQAQIEALQTQLATTTRHADRAEATAATDHAALLALQARVARLLGEEAQARH